MSPDIIWTGIAAVTITDADQERFQTTVSEFHPQPEPDSCLPTALKNVLHELAERKDEPALKHSISDLADALDYKKHRASASDRLASRIDPLLEEAGYEVNLMVGVDFEQLQQIITSEDRSLPICELHESYFESIRSEDRGYVPEAGRDGYGGWQHVVIPFKINDENVLYFDPFVQFFHNIDELDDSGAMTQPIKAFNEWWSRPEKRWTLWVEQSEQKTLSEAIEGE